MILRVERRWKKASYTIGKLWVNGDLFCDTLEDTDRGLRKSMLSQDIAQKKISARTAIPTGEYEISLRVYSAKFGARPFYRRVCGGYLPRLMLVPAFEGVLIHCGNSAMDTEGCILVGENKVVGGLVNSQPVFERLVQRLQEAYKRGEQITIKIE